MFHKIIAITLLITCCVVGAQDTSDDPATQASAVFAQARSMMAELMKVERNDEAYGRLCAEILPLLQEATALFDQAVAESDDSSLRLRAAGCVMQRGHILGTQNRMLEALAANKDAQARFLAISDQPIAPLLAVRCEVAIGVAYKRLAKQDDIAHAAIAIDHLQRALDDSYDLDDALPLKAATVANCHLELGPALLLGGPTHDHSSGVAHLEQAIDILDPLAERDPRAREALVGAYINLGTALANYGSPAEAITNFERALRLATREHSLALCELNLGVAWDQLGDLTAATAHLERAVARFSEQADMGEYEAIARQALGAAQQALFRPDAAVEELTKAVRFYETEGMPARQQYAMITLAAALSDTESDEQAMATIAAASELTEPSIETRRYSLAAECHIHKVAGRLADARSAGEEALRLYGDEVGALQNRIACHVLLGDIAIESSEPQDATEHLLDALNLGWRYLVLNAMWLPTERKRQFIKTHLLPIGDRLVHLSLVPGSNVSPAVGYEAALRLKCMAREMSLHEARIVGEHDDSAAATVRRALDDARGQLSRLMVATDRRVPTGDSPPDERAKLADAQSTVLDLEHELRTLESRSFGDRLRLEVVRGEDVRKAIEQREVLLEYVTYTPWSTSGDQSETRYAVFVVSDTIAAIDLGPVEDIDGHVAAYRNRLTRDSRRYFDPVVEWGDPRQLRDSERKLADIGTRIRRLVLDPIAGHMPLNVDRLYVAPDGALGLIAFGVLPQRAPAQIERLPRYLHEEGPQHIYLVTGRDLVRFGWLDASSQDLWFVKAPDYDAPAERRREVLEQWRAGGLMLAVNPGEARRLDLPAAELDHPVDLSTGGGKLDQLGEAALQLAASVESIAASQATRVRVLSGDEATEDILYELPAAPRALIYLTHGGYMKAETPTLAMLESRLFLAGANLPGETTDDINDGVLTAYEVQHLMDLVGTEVVDLIACSAAVGTVTSEGVASLRNAHLAAGARSVIASLWDLPQRETEVLATNFYENWLTQGEPRGESLWKAQTAVLNRLRVDTAIRCGHPLFWGGLTLAGDAN